MIDLTHVSPSVVTRADDFIQNETPFHLGFLPTEQSNPLSAHMDRDFAQSSVAGVATLQRVDREVLTMAKRLFQSDEFAKLAAATFDTIRSGGRVIYSGCGATGRLSILLEAMWRECCAKTPALAPYANSVESIMTGGDFAMVKAVEFFEDYAVFGARQVAETNMTERDMLVAITEGGETSSVLGSLQEALRRNCTVFLLFNNPAKLLAERLERSRLAIEDPRVTVLDLFCGPMALAGSTRMQATTSEQLIAGGALEMAAHQLLEKAQIDYVAAFESVLDSLEKNSQTLADYLDFEVNVYREKGRITYFADSYLLDIFTDTTERSPTFMLPTFRRTGDLSSPAPWAFVKDPLYSTEETYRQRLLRDFRCLNWTKADYEAMQVAEKMNHRVPRINAAALTEFAIGNEASPERTESGMDAAVLFNIRSNPALENSFATLREQGFAQSKVLEFGNGSGDFVLPLPESDGALELLSHLTVKLALNTISTGVMAAMGRVAGNWMSHVNCTNKKLLDRGVRLVMELKGLSYREACIRLFAAIETLEHTPETTAERPSPVQLALQ